MHGQFRLPDSLPSQKSAEIDHSRGECMSGLPSVALSAAFRKKIWSEMNSAWMSRINLLGLKTPDSYFHRWKELVCVWFALQKDPSLTLAFGRMERRWSERSPDRSNLVARTERCNFWIKNFRLFDIQNLVVGTFFIGPTALTRFYACLIE